MTRSVVAGIVLFVAAAGGCDPSPPPRVANVHGKVTYKGKPVPGGRLQMKALGENPQVDFATAILLPDGRFFFTEAPVGPVKVSVDTEYVKSPSLGSEDRTDNYVEIPKKYVEYDTSGLTFDVQPGDQEFNIDLVP